MAFNRQKAAQEQARWEKEFALAQSKASGGSSGGSGGSSKGKTSVKSGGTTSTKAQSTVSNTSSKTSTKLSSSATKAKTTALTLLNSGGLSKKQRQQNVKSFLNSMYSSGKLNESDLRKICDDLGL